MTAPFLFIPIFIRQVLSDIFDQKVSYLDLPSIILVLLRLYVVFEINDKPDAISLSFPFCPVLPVGDPHFCRREGVNIHK